MSKTDNETFEFQGHKYLANPTIEQFLKEAGCSPTHAKKYLKNLENGGYNSIESMFGLTKSDLKELKFNAPVAKQIFVHLNRVRRLGGMMRDYDALKERESHFFYLSTGSTMLDEMMTYADGNMGLRSRTMIELFGEASMGKSQLCMTAAAQCMRPIELGGAERGVVYIDSEGAFEGSRFEYLCKYWGVDDDFLKNNLYYSRVANFDEVELALEEVNSMVDKVDIGLIVVDSIIDPLKTQYLVGGEYLNNLQPRQQHLQQVLATLKQLAENNNAVAIYTNHVRNEIGSYGKDKGPQGGHVMAHASDIRIELSKAPKADSGWYDYKKHDPLGLRPGRARIVDCGFLPNATGYYLIGPMGVADPRHIIQIAEQTEQIIKDGYLSVDSMGNGIEPIVQGPSKDDRIQKIMADLYGPDATYDSGKKTKSKTSSKSTKSTKSKKSTNTTKEETTE